MTSPSRTHAWGLALLLASASWLSAGDCAGHAQLRLVPQPGTYPCVVPVGVLGHLAAGERLVYTVDGTDPSAAAWPVRHPILLTDPTTVRVGVIDAHGAVARQVAGTYVVHGILATARPLAAPAPGTYAGPVAVTLSCPTPGATIRYTVDGSEPTERSPRYSAPLHLNVSTTVHARAWGGRVSVRVGRWTVQVPAVFPSGVLTARYVLGAQMQQVATPTIAPAGGIYGTVLSATATTATADADLRYRLDGADPQASDPLLPAAGLAIDRSLTLTVRGFRTGWTPSVVAHADYILQVPDPSITPPSGVAYAPLLATVTVPADAVALYTLDGSDPTTTSPQITGPVAIDRNATLRVQARRDGWEPSAIVVAAWTLQPLSPTLSLPAGSYVGAHSVTLSTATSDAQIHYTLDGSAPTAASPLADAAITLPGSCTLQAIAVRAGWSDSAITSATYDLRVQAPEADLAAGTYLTAQQVTVTTPTPGAAVRATLDGSDPLVSATAQVVTTPVLVDRGLTLRAIAVRDGWTASTELTQAYVFQLPTPVLSPAAGTLSAPTLVQVTASTDPGTIHVTTDGSDPTAASPALPPEGLTLDAPASVAVIAVRDGWLSSPIVRADYAFQVATPTWDSTPAPATGSVIIAAHSTSPDVTLRYTLDGSDPDATSPMLPVTLTRTRTVTVRGFRSGWTPSAALTALWTVTPTIGYAQPTLTLPVDAGPTPVTLHLSDATDHDVMVTVQGVDGTAVFGTDLTLSATTLTIPAGQTEGVVTVQALAGSADRVTVRASLLLADATGAVVDATASTVAITIPGVSGPPPTFTERRSPLWRLPAELFDAQRWADDAAYRTAYLAAEVPERVWETAVIHQSLRLDGPAHRHGIVGDMVTIVLHGAANMPVTYLVNHPNVVSDVDRRSVRTVLCDAEGTVSVILQIIDAGHARIVCESPVLDNVVHVDVEGIRP
jgi:hypothetical protein